LGAQRVARHNCRFVSVSRDSHNESACATCGSDNFVDPQTAFLRFCFNEALLENFVIVSSVTAAPKNGALA
jgi:hypothetical protein